MDEVPNQVVSVANKDINYFLSLLEKEHVDATLDHITCTVNDGTDSTLDVTVSALVTCNQLKTTACWDYFVYADGSVKLWQSKRIQDVVRTIVSSCRS